MTARLISVNVGRRGQLRIGERTEDSGIFKEPTEGRVAVSVGGLAGDLIVDRRYHGTEDQALYAYAGEDLSWWGEQLGRELSPGLFGENLTTEGLDVTGAVVGERWRIGTVVVEVTKPRIPCSTFTARMNERMWVRRFLEAGRPGAYLRVLEEGDVGAGDPIEVLSRPAEAMSVGAIALQRARTGA